MGRAISYHQRLLRRTWYYNIVEFKSLSDKFNPLKFLDNVVRTCLFQQQKPEVPFSEVLNVYVIAFYPREFFKQMRKDKCPFRRDKKQKWLFHGNAAGHDIVIVVGRFLPVEKPYYRWLLFSQSTTAKLQEFATMLYKEGEMELLEDLVRLKPKEVKSVITQVEKDAKKEKEEALRKDYKALSRALMKLMQTLDATGEVLADMPLEDRLKGLSPKELRKLSEMIAKLQTQNGDETE
jgi:hypothetical protein